MKKQNKKILSFNIRKNRKIQKKNLYSKGLEKQSLARSKRTPKVRTEKSYLLERRIKFSKKLYRRYKYKNSRKTIEIRGGFGIEEVDLIDEFLSKSSEIIDFDSTSLTLDIHNCTRVWPSAITLLCSLKQWVELCSPQGNAPQIGSSSSTSDGVNGYLNHSGFYDYVDRPKDEINSTYPENEIVKIRREKNRQNIEPRENEVIDLVQRYSNFSADEFEYFNCVVLTEVFLNVTEHGVSNKDSGWWLLAQFHPTHQIISLCIADNGIGFRNTLMTGPQGGIIVSKLRNIPENEGEFLKLAMEENVSGAVQASTPEKAFFGQKFKPGARRGNGLKRIFKACKNLGVRFSILSHHGYIFYDEHGNIIKHGAKRRRVFAGTLYHFTIKARRNENN